MRAKLIKSTGNHYDLRSNGELIASTYQWVSTDKYKLSKENCNELFGVVDVEKLAKDFYETRKFESSHIADPVSFKIGFNKAMELNKDKLFTEDDLRLAMHFGKFGEVNGQTTTIGFIQSLQQPTEIEVEIVMETIIGFFDYKELRKQPKLDSSGNLILKKI